MTDYSEQEFNEHCARLDGWANIENDIWFNKNTSAETRYHDLPDYFNDLNLLMPLAWKYGIYVIPYLVTSEGIQSWIARNYELQNCIDADPDKAIRDCLMQIPVEGE